MKNAILLGTVIMVLSSCGNNSSTNATTSTKDTVVCKKDSCKKDSCCIKSVNIVADSTKKSK